MASSRGRGMTEAFDLSNPSKPVRTGAWPWADQTGACNWHNGLLLFGADGFASIDGEGRLKPAGPACEAARVADAIVGADVVYALTDEALEVRSLRLCRTRQVECAGGRSLVRLGSKLIAGGRNGLALFDVSDPARPRLELTAAGLPVVEVCAPRDVSSGSVVVVLDDGSARMLMLRDGTFEETARFVQPPWFVGTAQLGDLLIRIGEGRLHLDIGRLGESQLVAEKPGPDILTER